MSGPPAGQQERTLLAWRRTSLALVGTSLVALHLAITQGKRQRNRGGIRLRGVRVGHRTRVATRVQLICRRSPLTCSPTAAELAVHRVARGGGDRLRRISALRLSSSDDSAPHRRTLLHLRSRCQRSGEDLPSE